MDPNLAMFNSLNPLVRQISDQFSLEMTEKDYQYTIRHSSHYSSHRLQQIFDQYAPPFNFQGSFEIRENLFDNDKIISYIPYSQYSEISPVLENLIPSNTNDPVQTLTNQLAQTNLSTSQNSIVTAQPRILDFILAREHSPAPPYINNFPIVPTLIKPASPNLRKSTMVENLEKKASKPQIIKPKKLQFNPTALNNRRIISKNGRH